MSEAEPKIGKQTNESEKENRFITIPKKLLEKYGMPNYTYKKKDDGVHFIIKMPKEAIYSRDINVLNDTPQWEKDHLSPFLREAYNETRDIAWKFVQHNEVTDYWEIIFYKDAHKIRR